LDSSDLTDGVSRALRIVTQGAPGLSLTGAREKEDEPGQTTSTNENHVRTKIRKNSCG
jgi:hypothetical protein